MFPLITILGPTACGKTHIATETAYRLGGEIISADSRQVFRGMDIGTGKDLLEYRIHDTNIPYHLIDIRQPGYEYSAGEFYRDFWVAYDQIQNQNHVPMQTDEELAQLLQTYIKLHNHTDTESRERMLRAIEIQEYKKTHPFEQRTDFSSIVFGIAYPRQTIMQRIRQRLEQRLQEGMVDEVQKLLDNGVPPERLLRYGLEYRYVTLYLQKQLSYDEMVEKLNIAIRQFAKRQMTWFRGMERRGFHIHWIDATLPMEEKVSAIINCWDAET